MSEATRLKIVVPKSPSMASPATKFHENPPIGSKVINGGHTKTHRQAGAMISILSFFESRLKD
jgi:hypothetical protein